MRILVVSSAVPFPPIGGGRLRTYHLLRALAVDHDVTLVGFTFGESEGIGQYQPPFPVRMVCVPWELPSLYQRMQGDEESAARDATALLEDECAEPWFVSFYDSDRMTDALRGLNGEEFDAVLFEGTDMARFLPIFPERTPKVLDFMDVHSLMARRVAEAASGPPAKRQRHEAARTLRFEREMAQQCALCLACSEQEAAAAKQLLGAEHVSVIPNGVDTSYFQPAAAAAEVDGAIVFTGSMDYPPNIEAVRHFAIEIFPQLRVAMPTARFHVVGANPSPEVKSLANDAIVVHGRVPDMRPYLAMATVIVVPILSGGGTRLKILEAAASGKAIVTTSLGAEGLDFHDGDEILIADSPTAFVAAILALAANPERRRQMGQRARKISLQYDWDRIGATLRSAVENLRREQTWTLTV